MDEIRIVDDIDPGILYQIQHLLREKRWYELLKVSSINSLDFSKYIEKTGNGKYVNLERAFLDCCANVPIQDFIKWLEAIHLEEALLLLKADEPLKIIEEPNRLIEVVLEEDDRLTLSCKAQGFPTPKYEWFHNEKKLYKGAVLEISPIRFADEGVYYCQVSNISRNGIKTMVFTSGTRVTVSPPRVNNLPKIVQQPFSPTTQKVYPGRTFTITCKAESEYPLTYQWYCDGNILEGKTSPQLDTMFHLNDVCEKKRFECIVTNEYGSVASNSIILELEPDKEYYAEDKFALLIGNSQYDYLSSLTQPAKDVCTLSKLLQSIGFKTFCFQNLTSKEMRNAIKLFSSFLRPGVYALFYFAGHGYQHKRYSLLGKETKHIVNDESISPEEVLNFMQQGKPEVNVILLDTCRKPSSELKSDNKVTEEKFEDGLLGNTIIGYATSFPYSAYEIKGQSSIFVQYLKVHIKKCIPITEMILKVIEDVKEDPANVSLQYPYLKGSLTSNLKLTDSITRQGEIYEHETKRWKSIIGVPKEKIISLENLGVKISILFSPYQDAFCNAMTIDVYLTAMPEYSVDDYAVHIKFWNVACKEEQPTATSGKLIPAFSISLFNLQNQETIRGKLSVHHKKRMAKCYEEEICVLPMISRALSYYV